MTFWTPSGLRMLSKLLRPNSDAEEMTRVPAPTILSRIPCSKRTSLMASSGISIDRLAMNPCRWITRSLVTAKFEVSHAMSFGNG